MPLRPFSGFLAGAAALLLAGCAGQPLPVPESRVPVPQNAPAPVRDAAIALEARRTALTFVQVVEQVEPVAEAECRERAPRLDCDFLILVDDRPGVPANAFHTVNDSGQPIIAFTLALIADARNADELAFVMSHEAAHHIAGHLDRQRENATAGAVVFGQLAGVLGARTAGEVARAQEIGAVVGARSYSREFELEADRLGAIITARAGYDPLRGADFFFRIPDPGDAFLSTHPPNAQRLEAVRQTVALLEAGG